MTKNVVVVDFGGLEMLRAVAVSAGKVEMLKLVQSVVAELRTEAPYDLFADVLVRHLWDEFCWCQQEGPFMDNLESVIKSRITSALNKIDDQSLVCLTAFSQDEFGEVGEDGELEVGVICANDIEDFAYQRIQEEAQRPEVNILGHNRADELGFHLTANGVVFSELSEDELSSALADHFEDIINPDSDLSNLADTLSQTFLERIKEESDSFCLSALLTKFEPEFGKLIVKGDILSDLQDTRAALLEALDPPIAR